MARIPVMMFLTTTAIDIEEELLNRCVVLSVNEDREQTKAIHRLWREQQTLAGLLKRQRRKQLIRLHQNAQRLLKPLFVVNPFVDELSFPDALTRMRREHMKYLTLIRAIALLHQHQRSVKTEHGLSYIEATREDIPTADRLMQELMRQSLDELPAQTRRLMGLIEAMVNGREGFQFSRRDVRAYTGWGATQVRIHLDRLHEMEYLIVHRGGRGQTFLYEYDVNLAGQKEELAGSKRPQNGVVAGTSRPTETRMNIAPNGVFHADGEKRGSPLRVRAKSFPAFFLRALRPQLSGEELYHAGRCVRSICAPFEISGRTRRILGEEIETAWITNHRAESL